ncbi:MAG: hypothetical protein WCL49_05920 [bacterium]
MNLFMIDGIGPFFLGHPKRTVNWSKIPFSFLEREGRVQRDAFREIREAFRRFSGTAAALGFNAVSLDDLAHVTDHFSYPAPLRARIADYRQEFSALFEIARAAGLQVYLTTDISFFNRDLDLLLGKDDGKIIRFLGDAVDAVFRDFPAVQGIIARFGESDGLDVRGDFLSRQILRTPRQARRYVEALLAVCETRHRTLIMRTWSLGAYRIGDLMWNRNTYEAVFDGLEHPRLILSMKYGETDFFRYVPLNSHFREDTRHRKMIELQTRREYEGGGEYPSFIGWDYESYERELSSCKNVVGVWVWCQTGGWTTSRRITFVKDSSLWNEINVTVTIGVFKEHRDVGSVVRRYCATRLPGVDAESLLELLRLSSEVVMELLYVDDYARCAVYFRRLRLPPLLHVLWDTMFITDTMRVFLGYFVKDRERTIRQGYTALGKIRRMITLAEEMGLPVAGLQSQYAVYEVLAVAREYYFKPADPAVERQLRAMIRQIHLSQGENHYVFVMRFQRSRLGAGLIRFVLANITRRKRAYRLADRLLLLRLLAWVGWMLKFVPAHRLPRMAVGQGMGLRHFLK